MSCYADINKSTLDSLTTGEELPPITDEQMAAISALSDKIEKEQMAFIINTIFPNENSSRDEVSVQFIATLNAFIVAVVRLASIGDVSLENILSFIRHYHQQETRNNNK